jgi:hypothetical protein
MSDGPIRIANCSGFYGDRLAAAGEMLEGGPVDVLTGDYLAELTLFLLWRARQKDPMAGYATTFLRQMEDVLGMALERGVRIVTNAGGLNPAGLAGRLRELCARLGLRARIAHVEGDDLTARLDTLLAAGHRFAHLDTGQPLVERRAQVVTANAYLGCWGIVDALAAGADVVVCGRVTDASLVVGAAAWRFGWARDDWDRLAGAVVAGHILECGAQATGGNYAFFTEIPDLRHPGFPIAEIFADGSSVVTKHAGTGGSVSVGTVTAQLLYEIDGPRYANPDVVARFDSVRLEAAGADRVRVSGACGEPAPSSAKVAVNLIAGYRNQVTLVLTGLDVEAKARLVKDALAPLLARCAAADVQLVRSDRPDSPTNEEASAFLRITVKDPDQRIVGRAFSSAIVELALASYPGFYATTPPEDASPYGVYWPCLIPAETVEEAVVADDGTRVPVARSSGRAETPEAGAATEPAAASAVAAPTGPTRRVPLGTLFGARSGDKGGNANVGVWARNDEAYLWLAASLTVERFKALVTEAASLPVRRYAFPNLRALNFVVPGLLGEGALSSTRLDPQAKSLGEYVRSRLVDLPIALLDGAGTGTP